ncbi:MAG: flagellar export chaperone FlgN [Treponema sp.]|nr:flagellar export chaperone FlgN [Treponema sp.]
MAETINLSGAEVERRVAILKRFRELLSQQRDRFRQYLEVLDKQKEVIERGSADDLLCHVELEEQIVGDIFAIQKVIDPLEDMYRASFPAPALAAIATAAAPEPGLPSEVREVPGLRAALEELRSEAVLRSERNRELLARRMAELRQEMKALRSNPYAIHRSVYGDGGAALVDIKG